VIKLNAEITNQIVKDKIWHKIPRLKMLQILWPVSIWTQC